MNQRWSQQSWKAPNAERGVTSPGAGGVGVAHLWSVRHCPIPLGPRVLFHSERPSPLTGSLVPRFLPFFPPQSIPFPLSWQNSNYPE